MKKIIVLVAIVCIAVSGSAQDSTSIEKSDTIKVGNIIIIRNGKDKDTRNYAPFAKKDRWKNKNITTNWLVFDIAFNQINDQTNYASAIASGMLPAGANADWFDQYNFRSKTVNIWAFMQRVNLIDHVVNLKYGLGIELNSYKYRESIRFQDGKSPFVILENIDYRKNKLSADYLTVPLMLNFNFTPKKDNPYGFSAGISGGYLFASRQKTVGGNMGKKKYRDDFDLRDFKLSYVGEITLGSVQLFGSYATRSMFESTLDQTPYIFGLRFSKL